MHIERNLVAGSVAAITGHLNVAILFYGRECIGCIGLPKFDLYDVGFQIVQNQIAVDDSLQLFKQGIAFLGVVRADLALLLVAVNGDGGLAQTTLLLFNVGGELGTVLLKIRAQADVVSGARVATKGGVEVMRHIFAFNFHIYQFLLYVICI